MTEDKRRFAPATERNRTAILEQLRTHLPNKGTVLEIASGTGEHSHFFAPHFPELLWQPSDYDPENLQSIEAWQAFQSHDNLLSPLHLDAAASEWTVEKADYPFGPIHTIFNANMIHISPWIVAKGLMKGAGRVLSSGGQLLLYGPFKIKGQHTAPSNADFETWLIEKNREFGVRDIADVAQEALENGLVHANSLPMPANNFLQIFIKQ
ncbi:DUF938 domain-containing protein [Sneathiella sp.]|jgi:hypothetical protein|uniref:DUF938 domain-containing protein n=1 Tax=Sneathiella sp. TaxID=1964365 RepID=UPI0039E335D2